MKRKRTGFTIVELLAALGIVALMVSLLIPALNVVRNKAKETKQKAQFMTINLALEAFKDDYGDYPPSDGWDYVTDAPLNYCGAQKLAEALLGRDLLGFNKYSNWSSTDLTYYPTDPVALDASLNNRRGPYLELATTNAFRLGGPEGLFANSGVLHPDRFVLCDVFSAKKIAVTNPITIRSVTFNAGTPILYFKANTSSKRIEPPPPYIYDVKDNEELIKLGRIKDSQLHELNFSQFIAYIRDPKISARPWPYRPDSYILISAGADGLYGTGDDICNFGN